MALCLLSFVIMSNASSQMSQLGQRPPSASVHGQLDTPLLSSDQVESLSISSDPATKEQKLQAYDKDLEACYQKASAEQQKIMAGIAQQVDPNESCVECSCCCFWRPSYKPRFQGLATQLFNSSNGYKSFAVPQFQAHCRTQRFLDNVEDVLSYYDYKGCINYMPQDLDAPSLDGVYPIHAIVGTVDQTFRNSDRGGLGLVYVESEYRADVLRAALAKKVDICVRDADGNTPLMLAASRSLPMTKLLVKHMQSKGLPVHERVNDTNKKGETALIQVAQAVRSGKIPRFEWQKAGDYYPASIASIENRALATPNYLIGLRADPKVKDAQGNSFESLAQGNMYLKAAWDAHENAVLKRALADQGPQEQKMQ